MTCDGQRTHKQFEGIQIMKDVRSPPAFSSSHRFVLIFRPLRQILTFRSPDRQIEDLLDSVSVVD